MFIVIVQTSWHDAYTLASPRSFATDTIPVAITVNSQSNKLYLVNDDNSITVLNVATENRSSSILFKGYEAWSDPSISLDVNENINNMYATNKYSEHPYVMDGPSKPESLSSTIDVEVGNKTYLLAYQMTNGGSITDIRINPEIQNVLVSVTSPADGYLSLIFPRGLYDALSFTDHGPAVFVDGIPENPDLFTSCDQISMRIPIKAGTTEVEFVVADILMVHSHPYPPRLDFKKTFVEEGEKFSIRLITDATRCDTFFIKEEKKIHIDIEGGNEVAGEQGYFRITIPHDLLNGSYTVLADGKPVSFTEEQFFTKNYTEIEVESAVGDDFTPVKASHLVFNYPKDAMSIDVIGTTVIPEFGSITIFVMAAITGAIVVATRYHKIKW